MTEYYNYQKEKINTIYNFWITVTLTMIQLTIIWGSAFLYSHKNLMRPNFWKYFKLKVPANRSGNFPILQIGNKLVVNCI